MASHTVRALVVGLIVLAGSYPVQAYGPIGHQIVGAVADARIANTPTGAKVTALLDGMTLEKTSVIPDEIRGWDKKGADDPDIFHYSAHPRIDAQLRDFWRANQPTHDLNSAMPSHHWFHYTDVPVMFPEKYGDGKAGRSQWDIVHMIRYCTAVLSGEEPEQNARKITKSIAVILLSHYVGDIHQPLHVGAEFFDAEGHVVDPNRDGKSLEDQGGNTLTLELATAAPGVGKSAKFHSFWDTATVEANLPQMPVDMPKEERRAKIDAAKGELIREFLTHEPPDWRLPAAIPVTDYAEAWANEILPIAREAHERLEFHNMAPRQDEFQVVAAGTATEKPTPDHIGYLEWSASVARKELSKAGWRLADLLEQALK